MRAALGLIGLLLVLAIVMLNARHSARQQLVPAPAGAASAGEPLGPHAQTAAVREQVQGLAEQAAQRASDATAP